VVNFERSEFPDPTVSVDTRVQLFNLVPVEEETEAARFDAQTYFVGEPSLNFTETKYEVKPTPLQNRDRYVVYNLVHELDPGLKLPPIIALAEEDNSLMEY